MCRHVFSDFSCVICSKYCLCVFYRDPNPLAFPSENNELTQLNHTQQYHSLCKECEELKCTAELATFKDSEIHDVGNLGLILCNLRENLQENFVAVERVQSAPGFLWKSTTNNLNESG